MTQIKYILDTDGKTPIPVDDTLEWGRWMESHDRHVALTKLKKVTVSTVFLALDHSHGFGGPPVLWETMAFCEDASIEDTQVRYTSHAAAVQGHNRMVATYLATQLIEDAAGEPGKEDE